MFRRETFQRKRGFTLLELLVVMAIILILSGAVLPALARARKKSRVIKCLSNMKQLTSAILLYGSDYEAYPFVNPGPPDQPWDGYGGNGKLADLLHLYVESPEVYLCPSNTELLYGPSPQGIVSSYKYNEVLNYVNFHSENMYNSWSVVLIDNRDWEPRHRGGMNLSFLDGHVKWFTKSGPKGYGDGYDPYGNQAWYNWGRP